jgi:hypothetical protein
MSIRGADFVRRTGPSRRGVLGFSTAVAAVAFCTLCLYRPAHAELHWSKPKREPIKVRLVALSWNHQRSSFFASEEIFVAEKQLDRNEGRLVKLIYGFLPYQPRLSEAGFGYSTVYEVRAVRDESCDQSLLQMSAGQEGDWRQSVSDLKYSTDAPPLNIQRQKAALPCYRSTPEDYNQSVEEPVPPSRPVLSVR